MFGVWPKFTTGVLIPIQMGGKWASASGNDASIPHMAHMAGVPDWELEVAVGNASTVLH